MRQHCLTVFKTRLALFYCVIFLAPTVTHGADETLPAWNNIGPEAQIAAFVGQVPKAGSPDFVAPAERIVVFDNDGTLWAEQPMRFQPFFVFERTTQLVAPQHPERL